MATSNHITLQTVSRSDYLRLFRVLVEATARHFGFSEMEATQIVLSVDEALCNIIRHGYKDAKDQPIEMSLEPVENEQGLIIRVRDRSNSKAEDIRQQPEDPETPGGLGVNIIYNVMDKVEILQREDGPGIEIIMTKRPSAVDAEAKANT